MWWSSLPGGNDALNTVIPYNNGLYYDFRSTVNIPQDQVLGLDDDLGLNPNMSPIKRLWDEGQVAIVNGIGYPQPQSFPLPLDGYLAYR